MRICQRWRERGIPRYIQSLILTLHEQAKELELYFLYERGLESALRHDELVSVGKTLFVDELSTVFATQRLDYYMIGTYFVDAPRDGRPVLEYLLPPALARWRPAVFGIVYDFIPLIYPDIYLPTEAHRRQYADCATAIRGSDALFALSKATCDDGVRLLGLDPAKLECIYGSIDETGWDALLAQPPADLRRFGITQDRYLLYVGGDDWRKNIDGLITAFGAVPRASRAAQLVITCSMPEARARDLYAIAAKAGLDPAREVVITGYVSDAELVSLNKQALAAVFPSFYEGLGLPILESYRCGTPVIASNASSMAELVPPECAFDPASTESMADAMTGIVRDPSLRERSKVFGAAIIQKMTWAKAADQVLTTMKRTERARRGGARVARAPDEHGPRMAIFSCLPPMQSGIAQYSYGTLAVAPWNAHIYTEAQKAADLVAVNEKIQRARPKSLTRALPVSLFATGSELNTYDRLLYVIGNSWHNRTALNALLAGGARKGDATVYLHEARLYALWDAHFGSFERVRDFFRACYAEKAQLLELAQSYDDVLRLGVYGVRPVIALGAAKHVIVHTETCKRLVLDDLTMAQRESVNIDMMFLPLCVDETKETPPRERAPDEAKRIVIGHFGTLNGEKRFEVVFEAARQLARRQHIELIVAGYGVTEYLRRAQIPSAPWLRVVESPQHAELLRHMQRVDVAVQLRWPHYGEASGVLAELAALGTKTICTETDLMHRNVPSMRQTPIGVSPAVLADLIEDMSYEPPTGYRAPTELSLEAYWERFSKVMRLEA